MNENKTKRYGVISDILWIFGLIKKYSPLALFLAVVEIIMRVLLPFLSIILSKAAVDIVTGDTGMNLNIFILLLFVYIVVKAASAGTDGGKYIPCNDMRFLLLSEIFLKSQKVAYQCGEGGENKKIYNKAVDTLGNEGDIGATSNLINRTVSIIINILCFVLYSGVIGSLNLFMLAVVIILSLINCYAQDYGMKYYESVRKESAELNSKYYCIRGNMGNTSMAKDVRMFDMDNWLSKLRDNIIGKITDFNIKKGKVTSRVEKIGFLISMLCDMTVYIYLINKAVQGSITAGEFVMYFGAVAGFSSFVGNIIHDMLELGNAAKKADDIRKYFDLPDEQMDDGEGTKELKIPLEIEFRDVSFSYKSDDEDRENLKIFEHFNLKINSGEKIALVGVNGAGKTTLVKLLTGMYEPDEGCILINGIDRNRFARSEFYKLFSVVFQEYFILPFKISENVSLKRAVDADDEKVLDALEKAGLKQYFDSRNITPERYITKSMHKNGIELSGGQNQRLLLARALYKDAPVLVLDEPTAALDPIAESEIYNSYVKYTDKKTAIFISHRFASTRFSDRIIMLEKGKVIEQGTHEELMQMNGRYAQMFEVQSSYYESTV
ncbi:MAG: ABC transporter ATP-binding protein [Butyribacter sp.]|uniref:ABC transporter ATP-binding protein n=2 Tax=Lachnospiraceae TaxID=186803 RepID=UPI00383D14A8|nr:ABC transporter ATP-binding protein/permease [Roseburia hominis]